MTWFQHRGSSAALVHSVTFSQRFPARCVWHCGFPARSIHGSFSTIARLQRSGAVHSFSAFLLQEGSTPHTTRQSGDIFLLVTTYIRMASKYVGLLVFFHILSLNVVSQIYAFPTPTASTDGELATASNRMKNISVVAWSIFWKSIVEMLETGGSYNKGDFTKSRGNKVIKLHSEIAESMLLEVSSFYYWKYKKYRNPAEM